MPSTQTRRKRKVGQFLVRLRERAGHRSVEEAAKLLRRSTSQVYKIENGHILLGFAELGVLLGLYNATDDERREGEGLWEDAKQDSTRIEHSSGVPRKFRAFLRAEADARIVRTIATTAIPGLLQTFGYATAIRESAHRLIDPSIGDDRAVAARLARQKLLNGPDPLQLHALIDEGVIRRVIGSPEVMAEQLRHVLRKSEDGNVTVQVIGFDDGAYGPMSGSATILSFDGDEDPDTAYLEYPVGGQWVESLTVVQNFVAMFEDVAAQAKSIAESAALIRGQIEALEGR
jgi:hypothetical protein